MNKKPVVLVCKRLVFYELKDEEAFFEWVGKIKSIIKYDGQGDEIHLHVKSNIISDHDLRDLVALFFRYKVKMEQLAIFLNPKNQAWFGDNPKMYWHKKVFGAI